MAPTEDSGSSTTKVDEQFERFKTLHISEFAISPFDAAFIVIHKDAVKDMSITNFVKYHVGVIGNIGIVDTQYITPGNIIPALARKHKAVNKSGSTSGVNINNVTTSKFMKQVIVLHGAQHICVEKFQKQVPVINGLTDDCLVQYANYVHSKRRRDPELKGFMYGMVQYVNTAATHIDSHLIQDIFQRSFPHIQPEEREDYILYMIGTPEAFLSYVISCQLSLSPNNGENSCLDTDQDYSLYASPRTFRVHVTNTRLNTQDVKTAYINPIYTGENKVCLKEGIAAKYILNRIQEVDTDLHKYKQSFLKHFVCKPEDCFKLPVEQVMGSISLYFINDNYPAPIYIKATSQQSNNDVILDRLALLMSSAIHGEINAELTAKLTRGDDKALAITTYLVNNTISMDYLQTYRADDDDSSQQKANVVSEYLAARDHYEKVTTSADDDDGSVETAVVMSSCLYSLTMILDSKHLLNTDLVRVDKVDSNSTRSNSTRLKNIKDMRIKAETTVLRDRFKFSGVETIFARMSYCLPAFKMLFLYPALYYLQGVKFNLLWQQNEEFMQQCNLCPGIRVSHKEQRCCLDYLYHSVLVKLRGTTLRGKEGEEVEKFFNKEQRVFIPGEQKPLDVKYRHNASFVVKENSSMLGRLGTMRIAHVAPDGFGCRREKNKDITSLKSIDDMSSEEQRREKHKETYLLQKLVQSVQKEVPLFDENYITNKHRNIKEPTTFRDTINAIADFRTANDLGEFAYDTFVEDVIKTQFNQHTFFKTTETQEEDQYVKILSGVEQNETSQEETNNISYDIGEEEDEDLPKTKRVKLSIPSVSAKKLPGNNTNNTSMHGVDPQKMNCKKLGLAALLYYVNNQTPYSKITEQNFDADFIDTWVKEAILAYTEESPTDFLHPLCSAANSVAVSVFSKYFAYLTTFMKKVFNHVSEKLHLLPEQLDREFDNIYMYDSRPERVYSTVLDYDIDNKSIVKNIKLHTFYYMRHCMDCMTELNLPPSAEQNYTWQHSKMAVDHLYKSRRAAHFENKTLDVPFIGMYVADHDKYQDELPLLETITAKNYLERVEFAIPCIMKTKASVLMFDKEQYERNLYKKKSGQPKDEDPTTNWQDNEGGRYGHNQWLYDKQQTYSGGKLSTHAERDGGRAELFKILRNKNLSLLNLGEPGFAGQRTSFTEEVMACMTSERKKVPILQTLIKSDLMRLSTNVFIIFKKALKVLECVMGACGVKSKFNMDMINYVQNISCSAANLPILKKMCTQNADQAASLHVLLLGSELYDIIEERNISYHIHELERLNSLRLVCIMTALRLSTSGLKPSSRNPIQAGMPITYDKTLYVEGNNKVSTQNKIKSSGYTYVTTNTTVKSYGSPMNADEFFTQTVMGLFFSYAQQTLIATMASQADYRGAVMLAYSLNKFSHVNNKLSLALIDEVIGISVELLVEKLRTKEIQMDKLVNLYRQNVEIDLDNKEKTFQECVSFHQNMKEQYEKDIYQECVFPDLWKYLTVVSDGGENEDEQAYDLDIWIDM